MQLHNDPDKFKVRNPVVSIGIFDGVHSGHHEILSRLTSLAREVSGESVIITFWPHPRQVLNPDDDNLKFLCTLEEKKVLLDKAGIDHLVILPFTRTLSNQDACEFVENTLVKRFQIKYLVIGYNHHFGKDRLGDFNTIENCATEFGFKAFKMPPRLVNGEKVSSTIIREALWSGQIQKANQLLGYEFFVNGKIVGGKMIGRKIGFPTANVTPKENHKLIPSNGVYAVKLQINGNEYKGMLNIGVRPTINSSRLAKTIEVNIFDFSQDIYGQDVTLIFVDRMRNEEKYDDMEALVEQLKRDKIRALEILK